VLGGQVRDGEGRGRDALLADGVLERPGGRVVVGLEQELDPVRVLGRDDREEAELAGRDLGLLQKPSTSV